MALLELLELRKLISRKISDFVAKVASYLLELNKLLVGKAALVDLGIFAESAEVSLDQTSK